MAHSFCFSSVVLAVLLFFSLIFPVSAARKMEIVGNKNTLSASEELTITASVSGFVSGETIFIKGAFFKEGSKNYFGFTRQGDTWIKNSAKTLEQRQIQIGSWDGTVVVKSDYTDSGFVGSGQYGVKLGFYPIAKDGNPSAVDWSDNILSVALEQPPPTMAPTATMRPTTIPSPVPTLRPTVTRVPTIVISSTPVITDIPLSTTAYKKELVSDLQESASPSIDIKGAKTEMPVSNAIEPVQSHQDFLFIGLGCMGMGILIISISFFLFAKQKVEV